MKSLAPKIAVIVDGFRNGRFFAPKLIARGYQCIHVQSMPQFSEEILSSFEPKYYIENIINCDHDVACIIERLKKYQGIEFVIPGLESGVELASLLGEKLNLPTNCSKASEAFRDKYLMIEAVKAAGLKTADQLLSNNFAEVLEWVRKHGKYPVVIKPYKSAGTELVKICKNESEVKQAFDDIHGSINCIGLVNDYVLAQSFLAGTEYAINGVSYAGKHFLVEMWEYHKIIVPGGAPAYDRLRLLPYNFHYREVLKDYVFKALDALKLEFGANHSEVMLTPEGPALVENANRVMGAIPPDLVAQAIPRNQVDAMIDSYINPDQFMKDFHEPWEMKKNLTIKMLISRVDGVIKSIDHLDDIKKLKSFYGMELHVETGSVISKTVDVLGIPGMVFLMHEDAMVVQKDYERICELEKTMFNVQK